MSPQPRYQSSHYKPAGKLERRVAQITGGDSGIGRAFATLFAREGAGCAIIHLNEEQDAQETRRAVEDAGQQCLTVACDVGDEGFCRRAVEQTVGRFGMLTILINNAGEQHPQPDITKISKEQQERTFQASIFGMFYIVKAALPIWEIPES